MNDWKLVSQIKDKCAYISNFNLGVVTVVDVYVLAWHKYLPELNEATY
jgi:hypothetical protein